MLRLSNSYIDRAILSLRTGGNIGQARVPIINPNNLKIEGWFADNAYEKGEYVLPITEIRDFITKGLVVNDHDSLTHPEDIIRLKEVLRIRFELIGKGVVTEGGNKLGKVVDFAADDVSNYVQKLYVNPPILKGLTHDQLIINRQDIIEITDKNIIVSDATVREGSGAPVTARA